MNTIGEGKYELLQIELGRGKQGFVKKCRLLEGDGQGQFFAAKIIYDIDGGRKEADQLLQFKDHPNIVKYYESFEDTLNERKVFVIITELCSGKPQSHDF